MTSFRLRNGGDETEGAGEGVGKGREGKSEGGCGGMIGL